MDLMTNASKRCREQQARRIARGEPEPAKPKLLIWSREHEDNAIPKEFLGGYTKADFPANMPCAG